MPVQKSVETFWTILVHDTWEISLSVIYFLNELELICLHTSDAIVSI